MPSIAVTAFSVWLTCAPDAKPIGAAKKVNRGVTKAEVVAILGRPAQDVDSKEAGMKWSVWVRANGCETVYWKGDGTVGLVTANKDRRRWEPLLRRIYWHLGWGVREPEHC